MSGPSSLEWMTTLGGMVVIVVHITILSLVKSDIPGEGMECAEVLILYRRKLGKVHCWGTGKVEVATCCFDLVPDCIWSHGILELLKVEVET